MSCTTRDADWDSLNGLDFGLSSQSAPDFAGPRRRCFTGLSKTGLIVTPLLPWNRCRAIHQVTLRLPASAIQSATQAAEPNHSISVLIYACEAGSEQ